MENSTQNQKWQQYQQVQTERDAAVRRLNEIVSKTHRPVIGNFERIRLRASGGLAAAEAAIGPRLDEWLKHHAPEGEEFDRLEARLSTIDVEIDAARELADEEYRQGRRIQAARDALEAVPRVAADVERGDLAETEARVAVRKFREASGSWCLLLLGGIGSGKTTAAGECAWLVGLAEKRVAWIRASESARLSGFGVDALERFERWRSADLVVLDDLGTEAMTPTWQQALDDLLDDRYQRMAPTVITSNLTPEGFKQRYGERIADRVRQDGIVSTLSEKSMRRKSA